MKARMTRLSLVAGVLAGLAAGVVGPAGIAVGDHSYGAGIVTPGPLQHIAVGADLDCRLVHEDFGDVFFDDTACGTFFNYGGILYGPDVPAGPDAMAYTPGSQSAVTGTGVLGDPFQIETVVSVPGSGLEITQTDSYVTGEDSYETRVQIHNTSGANRTGMLYRAADCFFAGSDAGYGNLDAATGAIGCRNHEGFEEPFPTSTDARDPGDPGDRLLEWIPQDGLSRHYEARYHEVWDRTELGLPFPNTCRCGELVDNGAGLSWGSLTIAPAQTIEVSHLTRVRQSPPPPPPPDVTPGTPTASAGTGSVEVGADGRVTVSMPNGDRSDVTFVSQAECPGGGAPISVKLILNGVEHSPASSSGNTYTFTIPQAQVTSGNVVIRVECPSETIDNTVGRIVLYDPSGDVTDATTGLPISGATVTLFKVPGWEPVANCETVDNNGGTWDQPAPTDLGVEAEADSPEIDPQLNPQLTNAAGRYGWNVALGCWYVTVAKTGYHMKVSPVVGVPPEVTTLDVALQPIPAQQPGPPQPPAKGVKDAGLKAKPKKVEQGAKTKLIASLSPCPATGGDEVQLEMKKKGDWKTVGTKAANAACKVVFKKKVKKTTVFRASSPEDVDHLAATSNNQKVRVKK